MSFFNTDISSPLADQIKGNRGVVSVTLDNSKQYCNLHLSFVLQDEPSKNFSEICTDIDIVLDITIHDAGTVVTYTNCIILGTIFFPGTHLKKSAFNLCLQAYVTCCRTCPVKWCSSKFKQQGKFLYM